MVQFRFAFWRGQRDAVLSDSNGRFGRLVYFGLVDHQANCVDPACFCTRTEVFLDYQEETGVTFNEEFLDKYIVLTCEEFTKWAKKSRNSVFLLHAIYAQLEMGMVTRAFVDVYKHFRKKQSPSSSQLKKKLDPLGLFR